MKHPTLWMVLAATICAAKLTALSEPVTVAPDVDLKTDTGKSLRLSDLKGNVTLLDFWASWCIPCRSSFPVIDALQKEFRDKGLTVIAVSVDEDRRSAEQFLATRPHTMTIAFDPKSKAADAFLLTAMPGTFIVDRHGNVRFSHAGYSENSPAQYRAEILELLGES
jgi:thiol-disulfide isomerase/thioredoxin